MCNIAIIMSGGSGKRFWPASSPSHPKQFLPIVGTQPILVSTYKRLLKFFDKENIFICTTENFKDNILEICNINENQLILEPFANDTLSAFIYSVLKCERKSEKVKIGIFPCDHFIENEDLFYSQLGEIYNNLDSPDSKIILKGIKPKFPSTLYGYIEAECSNNLCTVKRFREKPSRDKAEEYLKKGNFYWNSGMLFFRYDVFIDTCCKINPKWIDNIFSYINTGDRKYYLANPKISFDYAVLEKTTGLRIVPAKFYWNDIGSWEAAIEIHEKFGMNILGIKPFKDNNSNWIISSGNTPFNCVGIFNSLIVNIEQGVLISKIGESHRIKNMV